MTLERPLLIFDGDCNFCRLWINRWRAVTGERVAYETSQEAAARFPEILAETFARSVVFVDTTGRVWTGAEAALRALASSPRAAWILWAYRRVPGLSAVMELVYRVIAAHRSLFSRLTRLLWGRSVMPPTYGVTRCLFLRSMALIYLIAFVSLWVQIDGLIGSRGILPIAPWLEAANRSLGPGRYWSLPTLCWLNASDVSLQVQCGAGALLSLLALAGLAPGVCFSLLWLLYLSLTVAGRDFLGFQWDNLLLEAGFLTILLSPLRWRCRVGCEAGAPRLPLRLIQWLVFRLMFSSGVVKLSSGDPNWRNLTALSFHYQTQCLPPWTAWYAHRMPLPMLEVSCALMFAIELGAPFLILAPRRLRHLGAAALALLQLVIMATGNYGFFNLLSIALCLMIVDDTVWPSRWRHVAAAGGPTRRRWTGWVLAPLAAVIFVVGAVRLVEAFRIEVDWPEPIVGIVEAVEPFRSINWYGLFQVMTTTRPEIVVEGSNDGATWLAYEFKWKPGDPNRPPGFVAPHMPRLDWQMWFAALGNRRSERWFNPFMARLFEGSPPVIALLGRDPFPDAPPRFLRARLYEYEFTDAAERAASGAWWRRKLLGEYTPVLSHR